jgi:hypothetical protein
MTQKLKKLAKAGQLKEVVSVTEEKMKQNMMKSLEKKFNSVIKSAKPFCKLLPFDPITKNAIETLSKMNTEDQVQFISAIELTSILVSSIKEHKYTKPK